MRSPGPVSILGIDRIGVICIDPALLLRGLRIGMENPAGIGLPYPAFLICGPGESDDVCFEKLPLFIDLNEFVVVFPNEPVYSGQMFIAGIWRDGHGVGTKLIELSFGPSTVGIEHNSWGQNILETLSYGWDCCLGVHAHRAYIF